MSRLGGRWWRGRLALLAALVVTTMVAVEPFWGLTPPARLVLRWLLAALWAAFGVHSYRLARLTLGGRLAGTARVGLQAGLLGGLVGVALVVLWLLGVSPSGIAVGGAVTGIVLGLAAQSSLGNLFAGVVLMALRPYVPGQQVSLRSWYFGGLDYAGRVMDLNFFYTHLADGERRLVIPNLAAAVATVTVLPEGSRRIPVALPLAADLPAARRSLQALAPGASLAVERFEGDQVWLHVDLPAGLDALDLGEWVRRSHALRAPVPASAAGDGPGGPGLGGRPDTG